MIFKNDAILKKIISEKEAQPNHVPTMNINAIINPGKPKASGIDATAIVCALYERYFVRKYY